MKTSTFQHFTDIEAQMGKQHGSSDFKSHRLSPEPCSLTKVHLRSFPIFHALNSKQMDHPDIDTMFSALSL